MRLDSWYDPETREKVLRLRLPDDDLMRARFDAFDRALLRDCDSKDATIADALLAAEMIARRVQEASVKLLLEDKDGGHRGD